MIRTLAPGPTALSDQDMIIQAIFIFECEYQVRGSVIGDNHKIELTT